MTDLEIYRLVKKTSIILAVIAVFVFLVASRKIYKFSVDNPVLYEFRFEQLNPYEKGVTKAMEKTGAVQDKTLFKRTNKSKNSYDFFDDVSRKHK
ncbi:hypothetical protein [Treponema sp.]|uniref:hypothetical protein n=1 Tax=Treponema sp. TaxID=166 RepID=UPI0025D288B4|nr:hypothetical protein [Treponema sp.]MCR5219238.1 hypothetical protein [Treponema sp.]